MYNLLCILGSMIMSLKFAVIIYCSNCDGGNDYWNAQLFAHVSSLKMACGLTRLVVMRRGLPSQLEIGLRLALLLCCKFNFVFRWAETSCWLSLRTMIHRAESTYAAKRFLWWGLWVQSSIRLSLARVFCLIAQPWQINADLVAYSWIIWIV